MSERNYLTIKDNFPQIGTDRSTILTECSKVENRATMALKIVLTRYKNLLDLALNHLTLGRTALYQAILNQSIIRNPKSKIVQAREHLAAAVDDLRAASQVQELPHGLLSRALLRFVEGDPDGARADLEEAWEIAERGSMKLHMADILLHRARLFRDRKALVEARKLIEECGYWRRKEELADAEEAAKGWPEG